MLNLADGAINIIMMLTLSTLSAFMDPVQGQEAKLHETILVTEVLSLYIVVGALTLITSLAICFKTPMGSSSDLFQLRCRQIDIEKWSRRFVQVARRFADAEMDDVQVIVRDLSSYDLSRLIHIIRKLHQHSRGSLRYRSSACSSMLGAEFQDETDSSHRRGSKSSSGSSTRRLSRFSNSSNNSSLRRHSICSSSSSTACPSLVSEFGAVVGMDHAVEGMDGRASASRRRSKGESDAIDHALGNICEAVTAPSDPSPSPRSDRLAVDGASQKVFL